MTRRSLFTVFAAIYCTACASRKPASAYSANEPMMIVALKLDVADNLAQIRALLGL